MKNKKYSRVYNNPPKHGHLIENDISLDLVSAISGDRDL